MTRSEALAGDPWAVPAGRGPSGNPPVGLTSSNGLKTTGGQEMKPGHIWLGIFFRKDNTLQIEEQSGSLLSFLGVENQPELVIPKWLVPTTTYDHLKEHSPRISQKTQIRESSRSF